MFVPLYLSLRFNLPYTTLLQHAILFQSNPCIIMELYPKHIPCKDQEGNNIPCMFLHVENIPCRARRGIMVLGLKLT